MEWQVILALVLAVIVILFPAMFIWYLNIGGMYAAVRERRGIRIPANISRAIRISLAVVVPAVVYAFLIWFFYGNFGWQLAVAVAVVFPIILFIPAMIWVAVVSGLYHVAFDRLRRRARATRRPTGELVKEPAVSKAS